MGAVGTSPEFHNEDPIQGFLKRCREIESVVLRAQRTDPENAGCLSAIWHYAMQQATSGNQHSADLALCQLKTLLKGYLDDAV